MLLQVLAAFVASLFFAVIFEAPRRSLLAGGVAGALTWFFYSHLYEMGVDVGLAVFIATVISALFCELMARTMKMPVTILIVPAIIPLVPGGASYYSMFYFVKGDYTLGIAKATETFLVAGSIAAGVALVSVIYRIVRIGKNEYA